jgi:hypothetical protein
MKNALISRPISSCQFRFTARMLGYFYQEAGGRLFSFSPAGRRRVQRQWRTLDAQHKKGAYHSRGIGDKGTGYWRRFSLRKSGISRQAATTRANTKTAHPIV